MRLIYCAIISGLLLINMCGCAEVRQHLREADDLYNAKYYTGKDKERPEDVAGYFESNMPDTDDNMKAIMVYDRLRDQGYDPQLSEQRAKVTRKIVTIEGKRIWPTESNQINDWDDFDARMKHMSNTLKSAQEDFGDKKECTDGSCELITK